MTLRSRWAILAVACIINLFAGTIYAWSVLAAPLAARLTDILDAPVAPSDLSLAFSLANSLAPIPMIFGGAVNDRIGPRGVIAAGGVVLGLGIAGAGAASSPALLIASYGLGFGLGLGLIYSCTVNNTIKFFPDRRGLAGGLATAFYGLSSVAAPPAALLLIEALGIEHAMYVMGAVIASVVAAGGFFSRAAPKTDAESPAAAEIRAAKPSEGAETAGAFAREADWRGMLKSPLFAPMLLLLMCGATAAMMVISQAYVIASTQMAMTASAASAAVSFLALANTIGRGISGAASDRLGRMQTLFLGILFVAGGLLLLALAEPSTRRLFYAGLGALGLSFGCFMGVFPGFTAEVFGSRHNSVNFAIMFCGFSMAGVLGPALIGTLRGMGLSYALCYGAAAVISLAGIGFIALWKARAKKLAAAAA